MKILITVALIVSMVISGLTSLHFFRETDYDLSSLLIITAYASIVFGIFVATARRQKTLEAA